MARNRNQRKRPGVWPAVLIGVLAANIGLFLGIVARASQPAKAGQIPNEPKAGQVYYQEGSMAGGATWRQKREEILTGQNKQVEVSEDELNAWANAVFQSPSKAKTSKNAEGDKADETQLLEVVPHTPNFRMKEGWLQIAIELNMRFSENKISRTLVVRGTLNDQGFTPEYATIGCARLPAGIRDFVVGRILSSYTGTKEVQTLQQKLAGFSNVQVIDNKLFLTR